MNDVSRFVVGVDIGGTHATAAVVDIAQERVISPSRTRLDVDSSAAAGAILDAWAKLIRGTIDLAGVTRIDGIGLAMPGPFDYPRGISAIRGLRKFESLFGVNIRQTLGARLELDRELRIIFRNDAECFGQGEAWLGAGRGAQRVAAVTLGTGLGSVFIRDGITITAGEGVPENGWLYCVPFDGAIAEEHFSARGLLRLTRELTGTEVAGVAELAQRAHANDEAARAVFDEFGRRLGRFLVPWLGRFGADRLVVGGSVARSWSLFGPALRDACAGIEARPASLFEDAAVIGAAWVAQAEECFSPDEPRLIRSGQWRRSGQKLMPLYRPNVEAGAYDLYPSLDVGGGKVHAGIDSLAERVARHHRVTIDGYMGVFFDDFRQRLDAALRHRGIKPIWYETRIAIYAPARIDRLIEPFLGGDDPLFGTRFTGTLEDFLDADALRSITPDPAELCIAIGPGAAQAGWDGVLIYLDLPKNELQFRARAGSVTNLGAAAPEPPKAMYKRSYFIDWVALNDHKRRLLPRIDIIVDIQRPEEPAWMLGDDFRGALETLSTRAFRVRPWFEPGPWGGQWMKENFTQLPPDEVNYAWSFELIVPENGLLFESDRHLLEASFDWLMFATPERVIGESSSFFGHEFPIRFDYLDTVRGGNLSVQCHPRPKYIREHFGERFTQDETYYIHHADPGARVYLGFREGVEPADFRAALQRSAEQAVAVDIDRYVASWPAAKHDLFLIPNGTIHCSGIGNLVLEISATPYIFTFKMYDWMRMDLDGRPRSLNIDRAFDNLYFDRAGERVRRELISSPRNTASGQGWRTVHLPTHPDHFYDVQRCEFQQRINVDTNGSCHVGNLVEGRHITVRTGDSRLRISYGETFIVPAAAQRYTLINESGGEAKVVIAFVKPLDQWHGFSVHHGGVATPKTAR